MANLLRRPAHIARFSRSAAELFTTSRSIYSHHTRPQLWSLISARQARSYASINPGDPKRPDDDKDKKKKVQKSKDEELAEFFESLKKNGPQAKKTFNSVADE